VSVIINAVSMSGNYYLLMDATEEEWNQLQAMDNSLGVLLACMTEERTYRPKPFQQALDDLLESPTGMLGKHIEQLSDLKNLDIKYLELEVDSSKPTSDYRN
jgi:hypothetical protein